MPTETLKDFLVAIGYKVDESSQKKFLGGLEETIVKANLLSAALEEMAGKVAGSIGQAADTLEKLHYQSIRTGAGVQAINAFTYAAKQLGSTSEQASEGLEAFGRFLKFTGQQGGVARNFIEQTLGVQTAINGVARDSAEVFEDIAKAMQAKRMDPAIQKMFSELFGGLPQRLREAMQNPDWDKFYTGELERQKAFGIDSKMVDTAVTNAQHIRSAWQTIEDGVVSASGKIGEALAGPLKDMDEWLKKHARGKLRLENLLSILRPTLKKRTRFLTKSLVAPIAMWMLASECGARSKTIQRATKSTNG